VHRIGRTGRAGKKGTAMMICVPADEKNLEDIERLVKQAVPRIDNPLAAATKPKTEADPAPAEEKPKRTRGGRGRRKTEEPETVEAEAVVETSAEQPREEKPRRERGGRGRGRDREDRGAKVVGMGDHVPGFIAMSFEERIAS